MAAVRAAGSYALNGPLDALEVQLEGALDADGMPPARVTLTGRLDDTGLDLEPLLIHALGGQTSARGRIGWRPAIDWRLAIDARGLDPGRKWPRWGGTLDGLAVLQGGMVDGVPRTAVDVQRMEGRLRDYPVEGHGKVEIAGERLRAHGVSLRSGNNRLELDGVYERVIDLEFSLEAADLSAVFPDAHGRLTGEGVVGGSVSSPRVKVRLIGQDMRYRDWAARLLEVDADISEGRTTSRAVVTVTDARAGDHRIGSVDLRADGSPAAHTAHAALTSSLGDLDLRLTGEVEAGRWRGELVDTTLVVPGGGTWRLAQAAKLSVDADRIQVGTTCLASDAGASACADFERTDHARSSIDIEALPLSVLRPWLPTDSTLTGELDARGGWSLSNGRLEGNVAASVSPGELTVSRGQSERLSMAHADTELKTTVDGNGAEVAFRSVLGGDGRVQGHVVVAGLHEKAALDEEVVFDGFGLTSRLAGELRVRHTPGGVPAAFGALDLVDGRFVVYGQRLNIEHGRVTFAGPLNDPGLDIRAVRKAGDVTAGIMIGGTVRNPASRVYSEPPLGEAEAFSLLLTGHTLSSANQREAALLSQAALNLGLEGSERMSMRIQSVLGLDELSVGDAGDASLILGKRLSPDLGVRYVHWLVRHAGSVFVNYRLTDHLSIEAESGVRRGLDLLFSVERDDVLQ